MAMEWVINTIKVEAQEISQEISTEAMKLSCEAKKLSEEAKKHIDSVFPRTVQAASSQSENTL
jgi:hypothetical protein